MQPKDAGVPPPPWVNEQSAILEYPSRAPQRLFRPGLASSSHHIKCARNDLRIQLIPEWIGRKIPGAKRPNDLSVQALLETIHTPHRITFVEDIRCAP